MSEAPPLTPDEVTRLAKLSNLELTADEVSRITRDLGAILGYVRQLGEVDVEGVPPTTHVELDHLSLRRDEVAPSLPHELALREAPRTSEGGFAVPSFVDEG
jgi:aspartyl-tRNA(Asn)/glutamyl-tRNA(Gln) amidotransferase subunit C